MQHEYIINTTDGSFDYLAPWGTATYEQLDCHYFTIDLEVGLTTLTGYGNYAYLDNYRNDIEGFICELDNILLNEYKEEDNTTPLDVFEELLEELREIAIIEEEKAVA